MAIQTTTLAALTRDLPEPWPESLATSLRDRVARSNTQVVVLDDDPTGTQTVHDLWVWTDWSEASIRAALADEHKTCYILTNSRGLAKDEATSLYRTIANRLARAAQSQGCGLEVISRSDSTLRGHFPAEVTALRAGLKEGLGCRFDGILICPCFPEGGRLTAHDIHWVADGECLVPAGETEYARDLTFGYRASNLREWVAEKTAGAVAAEKVVSISLDLIRGQGPDGVLRILRSLRNGRIAVVNAINYKDLDVFAEGLLRAEAEGKRYLLRAAASIVRSRAGQQAHPLLSAGEMVAGRQGPGLLVVGSYVERSTRQLEQALALSGIQGIELNVDDVLAPDRRDETIAWVTRQTDDQLALGHNTVLYTSRGRITSRGQAGDLDVGASVSRALVSVVAGLKATPRFLIAKGGITSSDIATKALGVKRALVLGQLLPGVPVWRLGAESRYPNLPYIVFPGNVGNDAALAKAICRLSAR